MSLYEKLLRIQQTVRATKSEYNDFGKYPYRSAEGIIEAIKPILADTHTFILLSDDVCIFGDRVYVKATATLHDCESAETISTSAFAREAREKKGMDEAQITGSASSYARKYALSGLLLLDDNKDADSNEYTKQTQEKGDSEAKKGKEEKPKTIKKLICTDCHNPIVDVQGVKAEKIAEKTTEKYEVPLCVACAQARKEKAELPFTI